MESIFALIKEAFLFIYNGSVYLQSYLLNNLDHLNQSFPVLVSAIRFLKQGLFIYLQAFELFLVCRLVFYWLPGINPYSPPFYIVTSTTDPILRYLSKRLPRVLGMDFSFLLLSLSVRFFIQALSDFKF